MQLMRISKKENQNKRTEWILKAIMKENIPLKKNPNLRISSKIDQQKSIFYWNYLTAKKKRKSQIWESR